MGNRKTLEKNLWDWLKGARERCVWPLHMERVENLLDKGWPDVDGCYNERGFQVELKTVGRPARRTTAVFHHRDYREGQVEWLERRWAAGGSCFVLIQVGNGHDARRYLLRGDKARIAPGSTEDDLLALSIAMPTWTAEEMVRRAATYRLAHK